MAGDSKTHNKLTSRIWKKFAEKFESKGCDVFQEGIKVVVDNMNTYMYPDVVVSCDEADKNDAYFVRNPLIIVEVLSANTETADRSKKFHNYRKIKSLRYYLLVSQEQPMIEVFSRQDGNALFSYNLFEDLQDVVDFTDIDMQLELKDVYEGIEFETQLLK
ncbi:MAG: Uma2 family endonuclease [Deinococcales bacterium]|nr:Uma2 family endonuclease [Chitinophagaceae bacterium]